MKHKTSFFNKTLIGEDLKRFWGIGALYFLLLLFTGPVYIFLVNSENPNRVNYAIKRFINIYSNGFEVIFAVIIPIVLAVLIFRYMQMKGSSGMIHSLPYTRNTLINSHVLSGTVILLVPVLINLIIMLITYANLYDGTVIVGMESKVITSDIYHWFFITLILSYTTFIMTIFTGIISGISFIQAVLSLIFLFLPLGLTTLILGSLDQFLFGFVPNNTIINDFAIKIIPITSGFEVAKFNSLLWNIWYIILLVILFLASKKLYNKRNLESATDTIVFNILKPLFKYGVTFCTMMLGGLYFSMSLRGSQGWLYFGLFIGALFGYIIAEMILQKSIWVFHKLLGLVPFIIVMCILIGGIQLDITGYEKRLPNIDEVESGYFGYSINNEMLENGNKLFVEKDNLINIRNLHQIIIENQKDIEKSMKETTNTVRKMSVAIGYKYKNGHTMVREYNVPYSMLHNTLYLKELYESKEYKIINNEIFRADIDNLAYIDIQANNVNKEIRIVDKDEINEFIKIAKRDILNQTYEEMTSDKDNWAHIRIIYPYENSANRDKTIYLEWKKSYEKVEEWLIEKGYYKDARILPQDIEHAVVAKVENSVNPDLIYKQTFEFEYSDIEELKGKKMEVKDKEKLEQLLRSYHNSRLEDREYVVIFYLKNGDRTIGWYSTQNALDFIKLYFR